MWVFIGFAQILAAFLMWCANSNWHALLFLVFAALSFYSNHIKAPTTLSREAYFQFIRRRVLEKTSTEAVSTEKS